MEKLLGSKDGYWVPVTAALAEEATYDRLESGGGSWAEDEVAKHRKQTGRQGRLDVLELRADGTKAILVMRMREVMRRVARAVDNDEEDEEHVTTEQQRPQLPAREASSLSAPVLSIVKTASLAKPMPRSMSSSKLYGVAHATSLAPTTLVSNRQASASKYTQRSLHSRDLRSMDPAYTLKAAHPGIVVRRHVILANFDPLRVVIVHDRMLVLLPKQHDDLPALVEDLCQQLRIASALIPVDGEDNFAINSNFDGGRPRRVRSSTKPIAPRPSSSASSNPSDVTGDDGCLPFELRALEAVLAVATRRLASDCDQRLSPRTTHLIELLRTSRMSLEHLEKLRRLKNEVSYQEARARDTVEAIEAALDSDEDMCMMRLAELRARPHLFEPPLSADMLTQHEDVEDLLENYLQHATATQTRLELLRLGIENAVVSFLLYVRARFPLWVSPSVPLPLTLPCPLCRTSLI